MPTAYESLSDSDVKFLTYVKDGLGNITNMNAPLLEFAKQYCKKESFGPKGIERRHYENHSVNIKFGPSYMDYPGRTSFQAGLYKQIPTQASLTYSIDHATMDAYRAPQAGNVNNNKGAIAKMQQEMQMLAQGLGHRLDFLLATSDTTGKVATATGTPSTTSLPLATEWTSGNPASGVGASQIYPEVDYDVINPSTGGVRTSFRVAYADRTNINKSTHTISFGTALGSAPVAGDYVVPKESFGQAPYGFPKLFAFSKTGLWQGKIVTSIVEDQTPGIDASQAALTNYLLQKNIGKRQIRNGTREIQPFKWVMSIAQELEYISGGWGQFWIKNGEGSTMDQTIKKARYHQDFESFHHIDADKCFGIDFSDLYLLEQFGPGVISPDGLVWRQMQAASGSNLMGRGVWYTIYGYILNWMIENPQNHMAITKLYVNPNAPTLANYSTTS